MRITFRRENFLQPLAVVAGVVERRQTLPILSFALIKGDNSRVSLTGTDLEIEVVTEAEVEVQESGMLTVPARKLFDICRALPEDTEIQLRKDGEKVTVAAGRSRFSLMSLPSTDFPTIDVTQPDLTLEITEHDFKELLEHTHFCMAQQDVRYYLNGLLLDVTTKGLRAVATDGHRMAIGEQVLQHGLAGERQVIIPRKAVNEIVRLLSDTDTSIRLELSTNHLRLQRGSLIFTAKLVDGRFPDYTKVIPGDQGIHVKLDRETFKEALARVAILSNEKYRGARFTLGKDALSITAHNPDQEEACEEVTTQYASEPLEIGFNINYIIDAVTALGGGEILMGLGDPNSSCTITAPEDNSYRYVVMPMRL